MFKETCAYHLYMSKYEAGKCAKILFPVAKQKHSLNILNLMDVIKT